MVQSEKLRVWPLLAAIALVLQALSMAYWAFVQYGELAAISVYVYILGLLLAAMACFLQKSPTVSRYLQITGAVLVIYRYGSTFLQFWKIREIADLPSGLIYGYLVLTMMWILVAAAAIPRQIPKGVLVAEAVLSVLMALMLFRWLGGNNFLSSPIVQILLMILSACGLVAGRLPDAHAAVSAAVPSGGIGSADELLRYKELLDQGILTQEEYDAKKRQLLGL